VREIVEFFGAKKIIFKSLKQIPVSTLNSRKKVNIYLGVNLKGFYCTVFHISKSSRVLKKEVLEFEELHARLEALNDSKIKIKYIIINAPLCSKAKALFEELGWEVWQVQGNVY
jgi:hypothetical protein